MCGIVGLASREPVEPSRIERLRDSMRHRGPDDAGAWHSPDRRVALGHRRLAIIDLSPSGHQPMSDSTGAVWVTYNGEIYNYLELRRELEAKGHPFKTASDTEVLLAAYREWGVDCVKRLNGMFAFGLFDTAKAQLFLARDRAGEKPLFYRQGPGFFGFASELKALMADPDCPRNLDLTAFEHYLTYGYVPGSMCILRGFAKLPQGHALTYDLQTESLSVWPYWTLPEPSKGPFRPAEELAEELEGLLLDSVRLRMIADVPVGIMLSGGVDSSLVTAMAARTSSRPVKTFTISFPGHVAYDEAPYARLVARHFGTEHVDLAADPAVVDLLPDLARQYDEPLADSSMIPTFLVSRQIRAHATVALGGDGGDELFGGYPHYLWLEKHEQARRLLPSLARRALGAAAARFLAPGVRGRNYLIGLRDGVAQTIAHVNLYFDEYSRNRMLAPLRGGARTSGSVEEGRAALCPRGQTPLQQCTSVDFRNYLVDDILVKVDRASMLTSLEVRAPWLDPRIIELAFARVPDDLRAGKGRLKVLPKRLAAKLLPPELDIERKQGFGLPLDRWFRGDWGRFVEGVLGEADPSLFDRGTIESLIKGQRRGLYNMPRLFALTVFELWRREYRVSV
jgi:asparagine synthase (glutamine-hydrolysing)